MTDNKQTVLIVDDELSLLNSTSTALSMLGFNTLTANDGNEAIETIKNNKIEIVVLDKTMPDMDGFDVMRNLAALELLDGVTVIIVSGYLTSEEDTTFKELGVSSCLQKPYPILALADLLTTIMTTDNT